MYHLWPNTLTLSKLKRDRITYQCKGSVGGGWGGGAWGNSAWCGDLTFFQNLSSNSLSTSRSFQSNAQKYPSADKFYQGCYGQGKVREK